VAESNVCANKTRIAGFDCFNANLIPGKISDEMTRKDFSANVIGRRAVVGTASYLEASPLKEEAAVLDDLAGDFIFTRSEFLERDFVASGNAPNQIEVRRGKQPEVLTVLFVNPFVVFGDDQPDTGGDLRVRRCFPADPLPRRFRNRQHKSSVLDHSLHRGTIATFNPR
jgi:hypothetical protein